MSFDDHQMGWKLKPIYIAANDFNGILGDFASQGVGGQIAEISNFGLAGLEVNAADTLCHFMRIPWDLDVTKEVHMRLHWLSDSTDLDTVDWDVPYKFFASGAALTAPTGDGTCAFDQATMTATAYLIRVTEWQPMLWTTYYAAGDLFMGFTVTCTAWAGTADEAFLLGMELCYTVSALGAEREVTSV